MANEPKISAAVGVSANSSLGGPAGKARAARIGEAAVEAIKQACEDGLRVDEDAAEVRERIRAAQQRVRDE